MGWSAGSGAPPIWRAGFHRACAALVFALAGFAGAVSGAAPRPIVVAYIPNWIDLPAFAQTIDYAKVTHLDVAFENPVDAEGNLSFHDGNLALIKKAREHGLKVLVSIGGGAAATDEVLKARYFDLLSDAKRPAFVEKLVGYVESRGFDGIDVDIEGPSINGDYAAFIRALSESLRPRGKLLTAALSKGYGGGRVPDSVFGSLDFLNLMAYDAAGHWAPDRPGQHSSLGFAREDVAYWLGRGLPRGKAVLGLPFYGYGFGEAFRRGDYPYKAIVAQYPGAANLDKVGDTIWYNGIPTIRAKCQLVLEQGLGGVMIWSLDSDAPGKSSLLDVIHETLSEPRND